MPRIPENSGPNSFAAALARAGFGSKPPSSPAKPKKTPTPLKPKSTPFKPPKTQKPPKSPRPTGGETRLSNLIRARLTNSNHRDKVAWAFLTKMISYQKKNNSNRNLSKVLTNDTQKRYLNSISSIKNSTTYTNQSRDVTIDFTDDDVVLHFFTMFLDGLHDKYLIESTRTVPGCSFRKFLTESFVAGPVLHLVPTETRNHIIQVLNSRAYPPKLARLINACRYDTVPGDIIVRLSKSRDAPANVNKPANSNSNNNQAPVTGKKIVAKVEERLMKENMTSILGLDAPVLLFKSQTLASSSSRVVACLDQESEQVHISSAVLRGSGFTTGITPEQAVDPGAKMTTSSGFAEVAQRFLTNLKSNQFTFKFGARVYGEMPKVIYKHRGRFMYSTQLEALNPATMAQYKKTFRYAVDDWLLRQRRNSGGQAPPKYFDTGITAKQAKKNQSLNFIKYLGDNIQYNPILFKSLHPTQGEVAAFATGDAVAGFNFLFTHQCLTGRTGPLVFDTSAGFGTGHGIAMYGIRGFSVVRKTHTHVQTLQHIRNIRRSKTIKKMLPNGLLSNSQRSKLNLLLTDPATRLRTRLATFVSRKNFKKIPTFLNTVRENNIKTRRTVRNKLQGVPLSKGQRRQIIRGTRRVNNSNSNSSGSNSNN